MAWETVCRMTPAAEFRACREVLGWSRAALAQRLNYASETSIRQIEAGAVAPAPSHLEWLRQASAYLVQHPEPPDTGRKRVGRPPKQAAA